jgi:hypothetical protein
MTYSCTDFADDVLNNLVNLGIVRDADVPDDDPEAQANLVIRTIIETAGGAAAAQAFFGELLDAVETLSAIADQHGVSTLSQLMYLQSAVLKGTQIDVYPNEAERLEFLKALPSGERWWKHVSILPTDG